MVGANTKAQMFFIFSSKHDPLENHEKTTFRAFLETKSPRDPPWVQERQILFRIALTRALQDQMAPQLCQFYVPGQPSKKTLKKHGLLAAKIPARQKENPNGSYLYGDGFIIWAAGPARGLGDPVSVHIKKNIGRRKLDLRQSKSRRVRKSNLAEM